MISTLPLENNPTQLASYSPIGWQSLQSIIKLIASEVEVGEDKLMTTNCPKKADMKSKKQN